MSTSASVGEEDINSSARKLYKALKYGEIGNKEFLDSIIDLLHAPLLVRIRHQLWKLGCKDMEVNDVFNEAMIHFLENPPDLNVKPLFPWSCIVTRNLIIDHLRKYKGQRIALDQSTDGQGKDLHPGETWQWMAELALKDALTSIPEEWSYAVNMYYFKGYTQNGLAKLLDVDRSQVDFYIRSARELLKKNKKTQRIDLPEEKIRKGVTPMDRINADDVKELTDGELRDVLAVLFEVAGPTPEQTQEAKDRLDSSLKEKERSLVYR